MTQNNITRLIAIGMFSLIASTTTPLAAQQRTWTGSNGTDTFRAELLNAYGDTVYFEKEDGAIIHIPLNMLANYDVARVMTWANERDAMERGNFFSCPGIVAKDICKQWPNRTNGDKTINEDVNNIPLPHFFTFIMAKKVTTELPSIIEGIHSAELKINAADAHFMDTVLITTLRENDYKEIRYLVSRKGGNWLMPNEWQIKDSKGLWNNYWRVQSDVNILIVDPMGNTLCDSTASEADGSKSDPIAFLNKMAVIAENMANASPYVPDPYTDAKALKDVFAKKLAEKTTNPNPAPIVFFPTGVDPATMKAMEGNNYVVTMEVGTNGRVSHLILKKGGDPTIEQALRQASVLWLCLPAMENGVPQTKTIGLPLRVKAADSEAAPAK